MKTMQIKSFLKTSLAAIAVLSLTAGCGDDSETEEEAFDSFGEDAFLFDDLLDGESLLPGNNFLGLPSVTPPASAGISSVLFGYNSSSISASEREKVRRAAAFLAQNPSVVVIVSGNCDERGTNEYNMSLGEFRAQAVRQILADFGIDVGSRVQTLSYGEENPIAFGHNEAAWAQNRRAEFDFRQGPSR